jgi:Domain of unknown function (DUF1707)
MGAVCVTAAVQLNLDEPDRWIGVVPSARYKASPSEWRSCRCRSGRVAGARLALVEVSVAESPAVSSALAIGCCDPVPVRIDVAWGHWPSRRLRHCCRIVAVRDVSGGEPAGEALVDGQDDSMRVSDAEREATLKILGDQTAVGRLSLDELEERSGRALTVRTRGELTALTSDLPKDTASASSQTTAMAEVHRPVRRTVAIMGGASRRGPFRTVGSFSAIAVMGGDNIDLREAEIEDGELTIKVFSVMGAVNIYVSDIVEVELGGFSVLGANREKGVDRRCPAKAPVIRVRGFNLMGRTTVFRVPLHAHTLGLAEARHLSVVAGQRPAPASTSSRHRTRGGARHHRSHHRHH